MPEEQVWTRPRWPEGWNSLAQRSGLPDTIESDWIESAEKLEAMMDKYIHLRQKARDVFELRYREAIDPDKNRWELCSRVLAHRDVVDRLSVPW